MNHTRLGAALLVVALTAVDAGAQTTIDFEGLSGLGLTGVGYSGGSSVPLEARLSGQLLGQGVTFSSSGSFVTLLELGAGHATSGSFGIGGSTAAGAQSLSTSDPIVIAFFDPTNAANRATTNQVSIRADNFGSSAAITLNAYDLFGALLATSTVVDAGGPLLTVSAAGIGSVEVIGNGSAAFDDLQFGPLVAQVSSVPEPGTWALLGTGLLALGGISARRRRA